MKIKYPITVHSVSDQGKIYTKTFDDAPNTSKLHHFDNVWHKIEGDYFIDGHSDYDHSSEGKYFLKLSDAKIEALSKSQDCLLEAREEIKKLQAFEKQLIAQIKIIKNYE